MIGTICFLISNKKPTSAATISHVNKPWSPVYSGEYIVID